MGVSNHYLFYVSLNSTVDGKEGWFQGRCEHYRYDNVGFDDDNDDKADDQLVEIEQVPHSQERGEISQVQMFLLFLSWRMTLSYTLLVPY